ncbi:type III secretion system export apparatus subunit SctU [Algicola sagamiensis]|uniref:type III secretion system export apparatus subunit SctU n=1 Tax=Algicola sagamiensis TaxID=163869 RepID=UPI00036AB33A|nr:type III secretion system export apparatus subunit SctU [Algicola sagamiensis]
MSEKTEQPTPKKLRDARKKGQVAHSKEVVSAALIIAIVGYFMAFGSYIVEQIKAIIILPTLFINAPFDLALKEVMEGMGNALIAIVLPLIGMVMVVGIISNFAQVGPLLSFESVKPELKKLDPIQGAKKIFSMKNFVEFLKSVIKILLLSILIYISIRAHLGELFNLSTCGEQCYLPMMGKLIMEIMIYTIFAFVIIAVADLVFQQKQHTKQLMMSKDEIKQEYKESEGNPEIKGKRKQFHQELMQGGGGVAAGVKNSDAIVANPTHVAIGIRYNKDEAPLPKITVKGQDTLAKRIKELAREYDIPIIENVPLARGLLAQTEIDDYIPSEFLEPVAEVLKWAKKLKEQQDNSH